MVEMKNPDHETKIKIIQYSPLVSLAHRRMTFAPWSSLKINNKKPKIIKRWAISVLSLKKALSDWGSVHVKWPVHCSKNNIKPLGLLKTFVIPQMEVVNIYGAVDGQPEELGWRTWSEREKVCVSGNISKFGVKGEWRSGGQNEAVIVQR